MPQVKGSGLQDSPPPTRLSSGDPRLLSDLATNRELPRPPPQVRNLLEWLSELRIQGRNSRTTKWKRRVEQGTGEGARSLMPSPTLSTPPRCSPTQRFPNPVL